MENLISSACNAVEKIPDADLMFDMRLEELKKCINDILTENIGPRYENLSQHERKKQKNVNNFQSITEESESSDTVNRPKRTAKKNADYKMKELIKLERQSKESTDSKYKENNVNVMNIKKEKLAINIVKETVEEKSKRKSTDEGISSDGDRDRLNKKVTTDSVILLEENNVIDIIDDDPETIIMPPPPMRAPRKPGKRNLPQAVKQTTNEPQKRITRSKIKKEVTEDVEPTSIKTTQGKSSKIKVLPIQIKVESIEEEKETPNTPNLIVSPNKTVSNSLAASSEPVKSTTSAEASEERLYSSFVQLDKINLDGFKASTTAADATFVSAKTSNDTFLVPISTYIVNKDGKEANASEGKDAEIEQINNGTIIINSEKSHKNDNDTFNSIMTEDNSDQECSKNVVKPQGSIKINKKNELFNPCIQSPLKKKIEAFEKHAIDKNNQIENNSAKPSKICTPMRTQSLRNFIAHNLISNSSSLNQFKPITNSSGHISRSQSATRIPGNRDTSVEDVKRNMQAIAEEKKKRREEKSRQVQQQREAKEKEKIEKYKQLMEEKEQKIRLEVAKKKELKEQKEREKRQLEEIHRNIKLQEAKREEQRREQQKKLERELLESEQQKLQHQLKSIQESSHCQKVINKFPLYNFDMLLSDDSTDDEDEMKQIRPPIPLWSQRKIRQPMIEMQTFIKAKYIDNYFSVKPLSPNLQEMFPTVDKRHLKRNSSVYWKTPPRYSELPKY